MLTSLREDVSSTEPHDIVKYWEKLDILEGLLFWHLEIDEKEVRTKWTYRGFRM